MSRPAWATSDRLVGRLDESQVLSIQVHLRMRDEAQAEAQLAAISDPDSASYGQFLSNDDFMARYAPTSDDVAAVRAHLEANGLTVTEVPANNQYVAATGKVADIERAFGTALGSYSVRGALKRAPIGAPVVPAAIAPRVLDVLGLAEPVTFGPSNVRVGGVTSDDGTPDDTAPTLTCSEWYGSSQDTLDPSYGPGFGPLTVAPCGYKPAQLRAAYGVNALVRKGNDGTGQTVAIVDAYMSPTLLRDAQTYAANNDPDYPLASTQLTTQWAPGTPTRPQTGWYGEQTLDVEAVHAMAPGAKIAFIGAQSSNDQDLVAAINLVLANKLASIVSNSYGSPEGQANDFVIWHAIATQAGLKGVGLYFSSGDSGDEAASLGFPSADFPASLDNATAVGGTSLALDATGARVWELGWENGRSQLLPPNPDAGTDAAANEPTGVTNDAGAALFWSPGPPGAFRFGAGGGTSMVYEQPAWQKGVVPPSIANVPGAPARAVPDVAMLADPVTGFLIGETSPRSGVYSESPIGGTSLACPLFSGTMALAQQHAGHHFGFANAALYKASKKGAFRDVAPSKDPLAVAVRPGTVYTFDYAGLAIRTAPGYDDVTGLGVPNGATFFGALK
jgi:subtilase family serine protease